MRIESTAHYARRKASQRESYNSSLFKQTRAIWQGMIRRCTDPTHDAFKYYGAEGITVCQRWRDSLDNFIADVGLRPRGLTLDRVEAAGNYEPGNVRWATRSEQIQRRRLPANSIPSCFCEVCPKCRNRAAVARYQQRKQAA